MFRSNFEKNLENATSHLLLEADWPSILLICDEINQKDVSPKNAFAAIKKKMQSSNPHSAYYALLVLESVVKNCGGPVHEEVFTKENCEMFSQLLEQTSHENVRQKMLELVQTWSYAFRSSDKYQSIKDTMTILKTKGNIFPELKEADAMFAADTAPNWADGKVCNRCRVAFTLTNRKHHCRNCGQVFCGQCTAKQSALPKYGIEKEVRVCDGCFSHLHRPNPKTMFLTEENELPAEYVNSSLAQQTQIPLKKSEQDLKEEEELQLALALSQSEAEQNNLNSSESRGIQIEQTTSVDNSLTLEEKNQDLAIYLNRNYWEQRKLLENLPVVSPSAPSPLSMTQPQVLSPFSQIREETQIDEFACNMHTQVEIFVNRMKSNSSRGRSIANDSSVQTLFMTLTSLHSQQLTYIKEMDDKRLWYEQLQDKLAQIKDSRAALEVLRQEHAEKLKLLAEEQEHKRQVQMAQKLEIMRKKKQEYLQYQRQLALQRIQEQEREMQLRQEQQIAQYKLNQNAFPFMSSTHQNRTSNSQNSQHQLNIYNSFPYNINNCNQGNPATVPGFYNRHTQLPVANENDFSVMMGLNGNLTIPRGIAAPTNHSSQLAQPMDQQQMNSVPFSYQPPLRNMSPSQQKHSNFGGNVLESNTISNPITTFNQSFPPLPDMQVTTIATTTSKTDAVSVTTEPPTAELISFD